VDDPSRNTVDAIPVTIEQLNRLLPPLEELEELRLFISAAAELDPDKQWAGSRAFATFDKRVISRECLEQAVSEAESVLHEHVKSLFAALRPLLHTRWEGGDADAAYRLIELGERQEAGGRFTDAARCYTAALEISLPLSDKGPQVLALRRRGRVSVALSNLQEAQRDYRRSAELARDAGETLAEVSALTGLGNVFALQGRWAEAEREYEDALARLESADAEGASALQRAHLFNNLGLVTARLGRAEAAHEWLSRAEILWPDLDSPGDLAICYHDRGMLLEQQGDRAGAREVLGAALALDLPAATRAIISIDLAQNFAAEGLASQAEELARAAEEQALAARSPYVLGHVYRGRGNIAQRRGEEGGLSFFEKALEIAREKSLPLLEGETLTDYALLRRRMGGTEEALSYLTHAREIFVELGAVQELSRTEAAIRETAPSTTSQLAQG
jgi:tetratricopeptide (TPR) repeat protein